MSASTLLLVDDEASNLESLTRIFEREDSGSITVLCASDGRAALDVLPRDAAGRKAIVAGRLLSDPDAQVRLAALLALSEVPADPAP